MTGAGAYLKRAAMGAKISSTSKLYFGDDNDFYIIYNPTSDELEIYDGNDNLIASYIKV